MSSTKIVDYLFPGHVGLNVELTYEITHTTPDTYNLLTDKTRKSNY